ncbi:hypothetical protein D3C81_1832800 [compost metagenome]
MHIQRLWQQRRQLPCITLGVGQALGASVRTGAGNQPGQGLTGLTQKTQLLHSLNDFCGVFVAHIGQQQALPGSESQAGIAKFMGQSGRPTEHHGVEPT